MNPLVRAALSEAMQEAVGSDLVFSIERNGVSYNAIRGRFETACDDAGFIYGQTNLEASLGTRHFHVILGPSTLMRKMTRQESRAQMIDTVRDVLVPRVGVEPTRPYGQRILSP